jgi:hypothetical protein
VTAPLAEGEARICCWVRAWRPDGSGRYKTGVAWSPSCFVASCGGAVVAEYVKFQREAAPATHADLNALKDAASRENG